MFTVTDLVASFMSWFRLANGSACEGKGSLNRFWISSVDQGQ